MTTITQITETGPATVASDDTKDWWEPLVGKLGFRARRRMKYVGRECVYAPGSTIVRQGDRADRMSLIIHGKVEVLVDDELVATLGPGDHFGEVAMLYSRPMGPEEAPMFMRRTATVRTTKVTRVREFDRAETMTVLDAAPVAATRLSRRAIGRLGAATTA
ncbi:MAG: cyclic nucleotide-binding domain-containing protein [Actinomycetota bacterium]